MYLFIGIKQVGQMSLFLGEQVDVDKRAPSDEDSLCEITNEAARNAACAVTPWARNSGKNESSS